MEKRYLALSLEKNRLLIGETSGEGEILRSVRYETGYVNRTMILPIVKRALENYITDGGWVDGIRPMVMGVAVGMDVDDGSAAGFSLWAEKLSADYTIPCCVDKLVRGATQAIRLWGCGRGVDDLVYLHMGGSLEAGFVVGGELSAENYCDHTAGEAGIDRSARSLKGSMSTNLHIPEDENIKVDIKEVFFRFGLGDELCTCLVGNYLKTTTDLIAALAESHHPEKIIFGGDMLSTGFLFPKIEERLKKIANGALAKKVVLTEFAPDYIELAGAAATTVK
jgi:predicted NBD/HSP70 family sugar kinase